MLAEFPNRHFQLWEYRASHGSLLLRSPRSPLIATTIDLIFTDVEYVALPRHLRSPTLFEATPAEVAAVAKTLGRNVAGEAVYVIESEGRRHPLIAASHAVMESETDLFDSPFDRPETTAQLTGLRRGGRYFLQCRWLHDHPDEPVLLVSELDHDDYEVRKVQVHADGRMGYADEHVEVGGAGLSEKALAPLSETRDDPQFITRYIDAERFAQFWEAALAGRRWKFDDAG